MTQGAVLLAVTASVQNCLRSGSRPESTLTAEEVAAFRMLSGLPVKDIETLYRRFFQASGGSTVLTREAFLAIPEIEVNPLKARLADVTTSSGYSNGFDFKQFLTVMAQFK